MTLVARILDKLVDSLVHYADVVKGKRRVYICGWDILGASVFIVDGGVKHASLLVTSSAILDDDDATEKLTTVLRCENENGELVCSPVPNTGVFCEPFCSHPIVTTEPPEGSLFCYSLEAAVKPARVFARAADELLETALNGKVRLRLSADCKGHAYTVVLRHGVLDGGFAPILGDTVLEVAVDGEYTGYIVVSRGGGVSVDFGASIGSEIGNPECIEKLLQIAARTAIFLGALQLGIHGNVNVEERLGRYSFRVRTGADGSLNIEVGVAGDVDNRSVNTLVSGIVGYLTRILAGGWQNAASMMYMGAILHV